MPQRSAYVVQLAPKGSDCVPQALANNQITIGWSEAGGLLDGALDWRGFREALRHKYGSLQLSEMQLDRATSQMWRFLRDMKPGDFVLIPYGAEFFVAEVAGAPTYDRQLVAEGRAYQRPVRWLNGKRPLMRGLASSALVSRLRSPGVCAEAYDLVPEIQDCLRVAAGLSPPSLSNEVHARMAGEVHAALLREPLDPDRLGVLMQMLMLGLGACESALTRPSANSGASLTVMFNVPGTAPQRVPVHTRHSQVTPAVGGAAVDELATILTAEGAQLGLLASCGTISEEARATAAAHAEQRGLRIEFIDGEALARLVVEHGIRTIF